MYQARAFVTEAMLNITNHNGKGKNKHNQEKKRVRKIKYVMVRLLPLLITHYLSHTYYII